jgi:hypothetical protein
VNIRPTFRSSYDEQQGGANQEKSTGTHGAFLNSTSF